MTEGETGRVDARLTHIMTRNRQHAALLPRRGGSTAKQIKTHLNGDGKQTKIHLNRELLVLKIKEALLSKFG